MFVTGPGGARSGSMVNKKIVARFTRISLDTAWTPFASAILAVTAQWAL